MCVRLLVVVTVQHLHVFLAVAHVVRQKCVKAFQFLLNARVVVLVASNESVSLLFDPCINRFLLRLKSVKVFVVELAVKLLDRRFYIGQALRSVYLVECLLFDVF